MCVSVCLSVSAVSVSVYCLDVPATASVWRYAVSYIHNSYLRSVRLITNRQL